MAYVMKSCIGISRPVMRRAPRHRGAIDGAPGQAPRRQTDRRPETPCQAARPRSRRQHHQCLLVGTADRPVSHVLYLSERAPRGPAPTRRVLRFSVNVIIIRSCNASPV